MIIKTNVMALNTKNNLSHVGLKKEKAAQKLSSGLEINSAADDAAGLAISTKMRAQVLGLEQANQNIDEAINLVQTAEGGLSQIQDMLHRAYELTIQAMNDTNEDSDRDKIQEELDNLIKEIDNQANTVNYNNKTLLNRSSKNTLIPITETITTTRQEAVYRTETGRTEDVIMNQVNATVSTPPVNTNGSFRFFATNANGDFSQLLFGGSSPGTSHPQIRVNGTSYDIWSIANPVSSYTNTPPTWSTAYNLTGTGFDLSITQHVSVVNNPPSIGGQSYCISYDVVNNNPGTPVSFDFMYHVDTMLGSNDRAPFAVDGQHVSTNTSYNNSDITGPIEIFDDINNPFLNGVIIANSSSGLPMANEPDKINLGQYNDVNNLNFTSSSNGVGDSGYAIIWSNRPATDSPYVITTYYGIKNPPQEVLDQIGQEYTYEVFDHYETITETETVVKGVREQKEAESLYIQMGPNSNQGMFIKLCDARAKALGIDPLRVKPLSEANATLDKLDKANSIVSTYRTDFGVSQNRLEYASNSNSVTSENLASANSRILDADMAKAMMEFTKANVLEQAATSLLIQANQSPEMVLKLLG